MFFFFKPKGEKSDEKNDQTEAELKENIFVSKKKKLVFHFVTRIKGADKLDSGVSSRNEVICPRKTIPMRNKIPPLI